MKVLVIGANGQIGQILVNKLNENDNYEALAGVRKEQQMKKFEDQGAKSIFVDLEGSIPDLENAMQGVDAVAFTAGSGGSTGADKTMMIDLDGAVKAVEAAKNAGVKRFVIVSAYNADNRDYWSYNLKETSVANYYFAAKYYADQWLQNSGLDYTIIRPTMLSNEPGINSIELAENIGTDNQPLEVTREDVADTIVEVLGNANTIGRTLDLNQGVQTIKDAVSNF